jgi:putative CocE/NonD family hydrolase
VSLVTKVVAHMCGLGVARTDGVGHEAGLEATMPDGTVLLADRWYPLPVDAQPPPTVLLRSPYGRSAFALVARLFAERGYQVVVQSCRGTFGSGGTWEPFRHERSDGRATLKWIAGQPWFSGVLATFGPSYLGLTQWAVAEDAPEFLRAMALDVTTSHFREAVVYPGGSFALETGAAWLYLLAHQELPRRALLMAQLRARRTQRQASLTLPLAAADTALVGAPVPSYQDWLVHDDPGDTWWDEVDFRPGTTTLPPSVLVGGWYDIFLPQQIEDHVALVADGRRTRLVIGPWTHASPRGQFAALAEGLDLFDTELLGRAPRHAAPVRLWVMGSKRWVDLPSWPPPADVVPWHLHGGGGLDPSDPTPSAPDRWRFDPSRPTPSLSGASLDWTAAGSRDQRRREDRPDVLSFTGPLVTDELTVAGPVEAELWVRTSRPHADVFVRLCDVDPEGRSRNLTDGILRLLPVAEHGDVEGDGGIRDGGIRKVRVAMWPTAVTFRRGHRIRLQVSGGAHPLFARNPGTGEPLGTAADLVTVDLELFHDPTHPSAVLLPVSPI